MSVFANKEVKMLQTKHNLAGDPDFCKRDQNEIIVSKCR